MPYSHYILDGKLLKAESPAISPYDRSFMLGDGLFETVKALHGKAVWLEDHLERMEKSAARFGIAFAQKKKIPSMCEELIGKNAIADGFLRITLSRGAAATGRFSDTPQESALVIIGANIGGANIEPDKKPAKAAFAPWPVNEKDPAVFHKTTSRFSLVEAFRRAKIEGLDEFVFVNTKDEVAEGIFSNVFWLKGGTLFTPSEECGVLPGIARAKVMERANDAGINVLSGRFSRKDIIDADEIFFTNSVIGVRPCAEFEGRGLKPGKIAPQIAQELF